MSELGSGSPAEALTFHSESAVQLRTKHHSKLKNSPSPLWGAGIDWSPDAGDCCDAHFARAYRLGGTRVLRCCPRACHACMGRPPPIIWRLAGVRSEGVFSRAASVMKPNHGPNARSVTCSTFRSSADTQVAVGGKENAEICFISFSFQNQCVHVIRRLSVIMGGTKTDAGDISCT